jgi:hypothetical protein
MTDFPPDDKAYSIESRFVQELISASMREGPFDQANLLKVFTE